MEPSISGLSPAQVLLAKNEREKAQEAEGDADAKDKLRRQVRHFVEFLQKEGVVVAPK